MIEEGFYSFLSTAHTSAGNRVYPMSLPQEPTFPAMVFFVVDNPAEHTHTSVVDLRNARCQVDCYGSSYLTAKQLAKELTALLTNYAGPMGPAMVSFTELQDFGRDAWDPDTGRFWVSVDVVLQYGN